jgi:hypothetical protein
VVLEEVVLKEVRRSVGKGSVGKGIRKSVLREWHWESGIGGEWHWRRVALEESGVEVGEVMLGSGVGEC